MKTSKTKKIPIKDEESTTVGSLLLFHPKLIETAFGDKMI